MPRSDRVRQLYEELKGRQKSNQFCFAKLHRGGRGDWASPRVGNDSKQRVLKERSRRLSDQWRVWGKRSKTGREKERIFIEAILTQRANWRNVEQAMANLEQEGTDTLAAILKLGTKNIRKLEQLIKPSGFYPAKAQYLLGLAKFVREKGGIGALEKMRTDELRAQLLSLKGVGEETADDILLYALGKPVFVVDEYTRRFAKRNRLVKNFSYSRLQELFEEVFSHLPDAQKVPLYQDYHAFIVMEGKERVPGNHN